MNHEPFVESTIVRPSTRFTSSVRVSTANAGARPKPGKHQLTLDTESSMPSLDEKGILKYKSPQMVNSHLVHELKHNENSKAKRMALIKHIREKRMKEVLDDAPSLRSQKHETILSILS